MTAWTDFGSIHEGWMLSPSSTLCVVISDWFFLASIVVLTWSCFSVSWAIDRQWRSQASHLVTCAGVANPCPTLDP